MRAFFAVTPPDAVCARLAEAVERAQAQVDAKWVRAADFHVTLVFAGELTEAELLDRTATAAAIAQRHGPIALSLAGAQTFDARVLWVGVEGAVGALAALAAELGIGLGVTPNHPRYTPHLTVARAFRKEGDPRLDAVAHDAFANVRFGSWLADYVSVYESRDGRYFVRAQLPMNTRL